MKVNHPYLLFKTDKIKHQFCQQLPRYNPLLYAIIVVASFFFHGKFGKKLVITSVLRRKNLFSVHAYWRGVDIGFNSSNMTVEEATWLRDFINRWLIYDTNRPDMDACIYGDNDPDGKHLDHLHVQTHRRSRTRTNEEVYDA